MPIDLTNPEYWRFRAEEARLIVEELQHAETKKIMMGVADSYERLAKLIEKNAQKK